MIYYIEETVSTNEEGKRMAEQGAEDGTVIVANVQTGGKGRMGRHWESQGGDGVYMSMILKPSIAPKEALKITQMAAVAVCSALEQVSGVTPSIKWPNDVLIGGKKICGILTELSGDMERIRYIICGIGINVNNQSFPDELKDKATSIYMETGGSFELQQVIGALLREFTGWYTGFPENKKLLLDAFKMKCINLNREIIVIHHFGELMKGIAMDIVEDGGLLVEDGSGCKHIVYSGEVSIRNTDH